MGDKNQLSFVKQHINKLKGPYLEIGSKDYGSTQDLRSLFASDNKYIGIDIEQGKGVDLTVDLTQEFNKIDEVLSRGRFGTIICLSVLEHCEQPFVMADNITRLLRDGGHLVISVPFAWQFHGYPSDYWRFTHEGIKKLFPQIRFYDISARATTTKIGECYSISKKIGQIEFGSKAHWSEGKYLRGISAKLFLILGKAGIFSWFAGYRYVLAPTMINMIGEKITCKT